MFGPKKEVSTAVLVQPSAEEVVYDYRIEHQNIEATPKEKWARILLFTNFTHICACLNLGDFIEREVLGGKDSGESLFLKGLSFGGGCLAGLLLAILSDILLTKYYVILSRHICMLIISMIVYVDTLYLDKKSLKYCYVATYLVHAYGMGISLNFIMEYCGKKENVKRTYINAYLFTMSALLAYGIKFHLLGFSTISILIFCIVESITSFTIMVILRLYTGNVETQDMLAIKLLLDIFFTCRKEQKMDPPKDPPKDPSKVDLPKNPSKMDQPKDPSKVDSLAIFDTVADAKRRFTRIAAAVFPFVFVWATKYYMTIVWEKEAAYYNFSFIYKYTNIIVGTIYVFSFTIVVFVIRPICRRWNMLRTEVHCLAIGYFVIGISLFSTAILFAPVEKIYNKNLQIRGKGNIIYINLLNTSCRIESEKLGLVEIGPESVKSKEIQVNGIHEDTMKIFDSKENHSKIVYIRESTFLFYFITKSGFFKTRGFDPSTSQYCYDQKAVIHIICTKMDNLVLEFSKDKKHKYLNLTDNVTTMSFNISKGIWDIKLNHEKIIQIDIEPCGIYGIVIHDKKPLTFNLKSRGENEKFEGYMLVPQMILWGIGMGLLLPSLTAFIYAESPITMRASSGTYFLAEIGFGFLVSVVIFRGVAFQILRVDVLLYITTIHYLVFLIFLHFLSRRQV